MHAHGRQFQLVSLLHIGVYQLDAPVKHLGTTEDDVFCTYLVFLEGTISIVEPCQVHHLAIAVGEMGYYTFLAGTHLERLKAENVPLHLYKGHVARELTNGIEPATVNMFIGIVFQQVTKSLDAQLFAEHLPA